MAIFGKHERGVRNSGTGGRSYSGRTLSVSSFTGVPDFKMPAPQHIADPDPWVNVPRGLTRLLGRAGGAIGLILDGDPVNLSEYEWLQNPRYNNEIANGIGSIDVHPENGAEIRFGSARDEYVPWRRPVLPSEYPPDELPLQPDPLPARLRRGRVDLGADGWDAEYYGPDEFQNYGRTAVPRYQGDSPNYDRPEKKAPVHIKELPPVTVIDDVGVVRPNYGLPRPELLLSVSEGGERLRVRTRTRLDVRGLELRRRSDTKAGLRMIRILNRMVTMTYGVVSELSDLAEVGAWSMYGVDARGRVVPAMSLEKGSMLNVYKGYLEGDYRVDAVGFAIDYAINQAADAADGIIGNAFQSASIYMGGQLAYKAGRIQTVGSLSGSKGGFNDVLQSGISWATDEFRSLDAQRSQRVSKLW